MSTENLTISVPIQMKLKINQVLTFCRRRSSWTSSCSCPAASIPTPCPAFSLDVAASASQGAFCSSAHQAERELAWQIPSAATSPPANCNLQGKENMSYAHIPEQQPTITMRILQNRGKILAHRKRGHCRKTPPGARTQCGRASRSSRCGPCAP